MILQLLKKIVANYSSRLAQNKASANSQIENWTSPIVKYLRFKKSNLNENLKKRNLALAKRSSFSVK